MFLSYRAKQADTLSAREMWRVAVTVCDEGIGDPAGPPQDSRGVDAAGLPSAEPRCEVQSKGSCRPPHSLPGQVAFPAAQQRILILEAAFSWRWRLLGLLAISRDLSSSFPAHGLLSFWSVSKSQSSPCLLPPYPTPWFLGVPSDHLKFLPSRTSVSPAPPALVPVSFPFFLLKSALH